MNPRFRLTTALLLFVLALTSQAYERPTHRALSKAAAPSSILQTDPTILSSLGLKASDTFRNSENDERTIFGLIEDGSDFEDSLLRPINHFYDPISGDALLPVLAKPSPTWALEDKGSIVLPLWQRYSFADARDYFHKALTLPDQTERDRNFGLTFESLGRVIHHIQDMAQPQHVRLDPHLRLSDADREDWFFENGSRYEKYTKDNPGKLVPLFGLYPPVNALTDVNFLTTARSFWHTGQGHGLGLADFTNRNFLSVGTSFNQHHHGWRTV